MNKSNWDMSKKITISKIFNALITAGKYAAIFFPLFFTYFFATIFLVGAGGDVVSGLLNLTGTAIRFPLRLLNLDERGGILPASAFWSLTLYAVLFLRVLFFTPLELNDNKNLSIKQDEKKAPAFLSLCFLFFLFVTLINWRS